MIMCALLPLLLDMQFAPCLHRVMLSSVACLDLPYFSILFQKTAHFGEIVIGHKMLCFDFLLHFFLKYFSF